MVSRAMSWMSTYVVVEISPETTTRPVFTSVSHATRPVGSSRSTASRTPSEIWSAILSGWPSVTDSEVNRYSLSLWFMRRESVASPSRALLAIRLASLTLLALVEVDDHRDPFERVALAQPVLDEVGVLARDSRTAVDLDREARWTLADLGHVEHLEPVTLLGRRLARGGDLGQEAVELGRGDAVRRSVGERHRLLQEPLDVAARHGRGGDHPRAEAQLAVDPRALAIELVRPDAGARPARVAVAAGQVPLVEHQRGRAAGLHRHVGDSHVLRGDTVL